MTLLKIRPSKLPGLNLRNISHCGPESLVRSLRDDEFMEILGGRS